MSSRFQSLVLAAMTLIATLTSIPSANAEDLDKKQLVSITYARVIDADHQKVRDLIANPDWAEWLPFVKRCEIDGDVRVAVLADPTGKLDGVRVTEKIVKNDRDNGVFVYAIPEPPVPVVDMRGTIEATPMEEKTLVMWTAEFRAAPSDVAEVRKLAVGMYHSGLEGLANHLR